MIPIFAVVGGAIALAVGRSSRASGRRSAETLADAKADARRVVERLGGQVLNLTGFNEASKQALADASERYTAAGSQLEQARSTRQVRAGPGDRARGSGVRAGGPGGDGLDPGPEIRPLAGQGAGRLTKEREVDGQGATTRPARSRARGTPYYYPGGRVQGRPVPSGWYSSRLEDGARHRRRRARRHADLRRAVLARGSATPGTAPASPTWATPDG